MLKTDCVFILLKSDLLPRCVKVNFCNFKTFGLAVILSIYFKAPARITFLLAFTLSVKILRNTDPIRFPFHMLICTFSAHLQSQSS